MAGGTAGVKYSNTSDNPNTTVRSVNFVVNDGTANSNALTSTVTITPTNDNPTVTAFDTTVAYDENRPVIVLDLDAVVGDVDSSNFDTGVLTISLTANGTSDDRLAIRNQGVGPGQIGVSGANVTFSGTIIGTFTGGVGTTPLAITLNANATRIPTSWLLRNITFRNVSENPSTLPRTVQVSLSDGELGAISSPATKTVNVMAMNDAPVLSGIEATPLVYTENAGPTSITSAILMSDVDNVYMASARVRISANYVNGQDVLSFTNNTFITGTFDATTGTMILSGMDTVANYRTALRSVKYRNLSDNPSTLPRTVLFLVNDGATNSNVLSRNITVNPINDGPVLSGIEAAPLAYTEGSLATSVTSTILATDSDNETLVGARIKIGTNYANGQDLLSFVNTATITGVWDAVSGTLILSGTDTVSNYRTALRNVKYRNTSTTPSTLTRTVLFLVNDGAINSNVVSRQLTVTSAP